MTELGFTAVIASTAVVLYTYLGYPLVLMFQARASPTRGASCAPVHPWPMISITVPMYNEEAQATEVIEALLSADYPPQRRQILVVSDGSTDRTEDLVRGYGDRGVELFRVPERSGKTAAENAAASSLRGDIVVNTDASVRVHPTALKHLIEPFVDAQIGLTSGRDISVGPEGHDANLGESGYVGYEMWIRGLETRASGIVGASGCLYAIRADLHRIPVPESLSRDFAAVLKCKEHGYRAVSASEAVCFVPRATSLRREYHRKVRTITRGMETLFSKRALMNPMRHGRFAWKLLSHKLFRWLGPWVAGMGVVGLVLLAPHHVWALALLLMALGGVALGLAAWYMDDRVRLPRALRILAFAVMGNAAAMHAAIRVLRGQKDSIWEPTRREKAGVGG